VIASFDSSARVSVFGSRANDAARGGDIDLLIVSDRLAPSGGWDIQDALMDRLGEQRIDVVIASSPRSPFERIVFREAVPL
jgi:predicted nucleotidyltransferase